MPFLVCSGPCMMVYRIGMIYYLDHSCQRTSMKYTVTAWIINSGMQCIMNRPRFFKCCYELRFCFVCAIFLILKSYNLMLKVIVSFQSSVFLFIKLIQVVEREPPITQRLCSIEMHGVRRNHDDLEDVINTCRISLPQRSMGPS